MADDVTPFEPSSAVRKATVAIVEAMRPLEPKERRAVMTAIALLLEMDLPEDFYARERGTRPPGAP